MVFSGLSRWSVLLAAGVLVAATGCDGDGSGTGGTAGSGGAGASGGSGGSGGNAGGSGGAGGSTGGAGGSTGGTMSTGGAGGGMDFSACDGKFTDQSAECTTCVQDGCADTLIACCQTMGCTEIVQCARDSNCSGTDCYFGMGGAAGPCKEVIDAAGGPLGDGAAAAQAFGACAAPACPMCTSM